MSLNQDSKCDANCEGCFRYLERKSGLQNLLAMPDYIRLIEEFQQFEGLALEISGEGEPLMSELTIPIIQIASQMGIWTTLITNGHRLTETIIKELVGLRVALVLSLHSLVQETYECDSGVPHSFKRKMRAIDLAAKHFSGTEWRENGQTIKRAAIHFTLQANNVHEVPRIREFCDKNGLLFSIAPLARTGHATQRPELWLSEETRLEGINSRGDESIIFYDEPDGRRVCGTCKYGLNIGADGELLLDAHGGYEADIANIRDISFRQAIELQHDFSQRMFSQLDCFCPVRDPDWQSFLDNKGYQ
ncbi:MAG: radical SAM protein [Candidatus Buchananbacteria bacterium]